MIRHLDDLVIIKDTNNDKRYELGLMLSNDGASIKVLVKSGNSYVKRWISPLYLCKYSEKEDIIKKVTSLYDNEIKELEFQIKSTNASDYQDEHGERINDLETLIMNTAKNMIDGGTEDEAFENRLKQICSYKKKLYSLENEEVRDARKYNGKVKFEIRKLEKRKQEVLDKLDVDKFM